MRWESTNNALKVWAPAKINLYLEIGPPRADGFHEIDSVFQSVTLYDELELEKTSDGRLSLEEDGIAEGEKNLVLRAARRLQRWLEEHGSLGALGSPGAHIRLRKKIPEGAGLGGGSSDAAAALLALPRLWGAHVPPE